MLVQCLPRSSTPRILPIQFMNRNWRGFRLLKFCQYREILLSRSCPFIAQGRHPIRWIVIDIHATNNEEVRLPGSQVTSVSSAARNWYYLFLTSKPGPALAQTIPMKIDSWLQTIRITCNLYDGSCGRQLFSRRLQCTQRKGFPTNHSSPVLVKFTIDIHCNLFDTGLGISVGQWEWTIMTFYEGL